MFLRTALVVTLALLAFTPVFAVENEQGSDEATSSAPTVDRDTAPASDDGASSALEDRSKAFAGPLKFHSEGVARGMMMKFPRDQFITLAPVRKNGKLTGIEATVVDRVKGNKTTRGVLDINSNGTLRTDEQALMNCTNIVNLDCETRAKLLKSEGPFNGEGRIDAAGTVRDVQFTHRRVGDIAEDGSMKVETTTVSEDGKVNLTTVAVIAPDGLPWKAETKGTIKKGFVSLDVALTLTRESDPLTKDVGE